MSNSVLVWICVFFVNLIVGSAWIASHHDASIYWYGVFLASSAALGYGAVMRQIERPAKAKGEL